MSGIHPSDSGQPLSEINVTPLVDVMLVLLVIFIIMAPMMVQALRVDLPKAAATPSQEAHVIELSLKLDGTLQVDSQPSTLATLATSLSERLKQQPEAVLRLHIDGGVHYSQVAEIISHARSVGANRLAFATAPPN